MSARKIVKKITRKTKQTQEFIVITNNGYFISSDKDCEALYEFVFEHEGDAISAAEQNLQENEWNNETIVYKLVPVAKVKRASLIVEKM